jgi:hypothetical protein
MIAIMRSGRFCGLVLVLGLALWPAGCASPGPEKFVDAPELPLHFVGKSYRATARGDRLFIEVVQWPGLNVAGFDLYAHNDALYLSPRRVSSGGGGTSTFEINVANYHLSQDWPQRVYWEVTRYGYPAAWSSENHKPWERKRVDVTVP